MSEQDWLNEFENHMKKYEHNKDFIACGINNGQKYNDWKIVVNFYAAVHLIEAVLAKKCNIKVHNHTNRYEAMRDNSTVFYKSYKYYNSMQSQANTARYSTGTSYPDQIVINMQKNLEKIYSELQKHIT